MHIYCYEIIQSMSQVTFWEKSMTIMRRPVIITMPTAILTAAFFTILVIGAWGHGGSKTVEKNGTAETVQAPATETLTEKLALIELRIKILLREFMGAVNTAVTTGGDDKFIVGTVVNLVVDVIEKIANEADAMVAVVEGHPGLTQTDLNNFAEELLVISSAVSALNFPFEMAKDEDDFSEEQEKIRIAMEMFNRRLNDLRERLKNQ
jgi:hypothetical protein